MFRRSLGFTLLEAMVAIVILSTAMFATYSWINVSVQMLVRADEVMTQEVLLDEMLEHIQLTNLYEVSSGEHASGDLVAAWQASTIVEKEGKNTRGITGFYDHSLHRIDIQVSRNDQVVADYSTRFTSYFRARDPQREE